MKNMLTNKALVTIIILFISFSGLKAQYYDIKVHYLGHASFLLDFHDFTALTDYGTSYCWGYNSPIYGIGDYIPAILTISHYHEDHYDPTRIPAGIPMILDEMQSLSIMQLQISPVRTCETTPGIESNTSFIFDYAGFRICHLGDAQAEIMNIADSAQKALILEKFPGQIDLLFMTIEGIYPFIPEAEMFIDLLQPGMVVPIHYWSPEYKEDFLSYLELQNDTAGTNYEVFRYDGPLLEVNPADTIHDHIKVFGLTPYPYGETGINTPLSYGINDLTIFPNPASGNVKLTFKSTFDHDIKYEILDIEGRIIRPATNMYCKKGNNILQIDVNELSAGIYFLNLKYFGSLTSGKLIILP